MYEIKVSGMTCGGCVKSITNALKLLDPAAIISVDLDSQNVLIDSQKSGEDISATIDEAGFSVISINQKN